MGSAKGSDDRSFAWHLYTRLEAGSGPDARFWEVLARDDRLTWRHGRVGSDGSTGTVVLGSPQAAQAEARARIDAMLHKGYVVVEGEGSGEGDGEPRHARNPELLAAIAAGLEPRNSGGGDAGDESDGGYLVYADWLQAEGDPRGQLIMLQHGRLRKSHDARLMRAERSFWREHGARMLPARLSEMHSLAGRGHRGSADGCEVSWHLGFVRAARIGRTGGDPPYTVRELLAALLAHPSGELVQELTIGGLGTSSLWDYQPVVAAIREARPRCLRTLTLAATPEGIVLAQTSLGNLGELITELPALRRLHLCGGSMSLAGARAPMLTELRLRAGMLDWNLLAELDSGSWPLLTDLVIDGSGEPIAVAALDALLAGTAAPRLSRLTITHTRSTRDLWLALARSPLLASLTVLDLAYGDLGDADVDDMLAVGPAFAHLGVLGLGGNYISRARRAGVRALCPQVSLAHQRGAAADLAAITEDRILELAPDARSLMAARDLALARRWPRIGSWMSTLWGSCQGSSLYDVLVDTATMQTDCTCPSRKTPCKHALALLMIIARGRAIPVLPPPDGLVEACRAARYDSGWE